MTNARFPRRDGRYVLICSMSNEAEREWLAERWQPGARGEKGREKRWPAQPPASPTQKMARGDLCGEFLSRGIVSDSLQGTRGNVASSKIFPNVVGAADL